MKGQEWYQADDIAEAYEEKRFSGGGRLIDHREKQAVIDAIGPVDDKRVLELACGTGRFTAMLAERGADITGLDISEAMLQQGREKAQKAGVEEHIHFMRGDAGRLPFPDDHFDAVIAMRFFHLADTPAVYLAEMRRVSKEIVFFDTFNRYSARSFYNWALPMGSRLYSNGEVRTLVSDVEMDLIDSSHDFVVPYGFYRAIPDYLASPFRSIDRAIGNSPGGDRLASVSYWHCRV